MKNNNNNEEEEEEEELEEYDQIFISSNFSCEFVRLLCLVEEEEGRQYG